MSNMRGILFLWLSAAYSVQPTQYIFNVHIAPVGAVEENPTFQACVNLVNGLIQYYEETEDISSAEAFDISLTKATQVIKDIYALNGSHALFITTWISYEPHRCPDDDDMYICFNFAPDEHTCPPENIQEINHHIEALSGDYINNLSSLSAIFDLIYGESSIHVYSNSNR